MTRTGPLGLRPLDDEPRHLRGQRRRDASFGCGCAGEVVHSSAPVPRGCQASAEPAAAREVTAVVTTKKDGVDEADHAEISCWMRPQRASRGISAGRVQLESYQKL